MPPAVDSYQPGTPDQCYGKNRNGSRNPKNIVREKQEEKQGEIKFQPDYPFS